MTKFLTASALTGLALAAFAMPASAITNEGECSNEGGTMVVVKGSDFCLVPIRDEAYADSIYDGNQLGVVECPGDKLNDGQYCMYPVTIRPQAVAPAMQSEMSAPAAEMPSADMPSTDIAAPEVAAEPEMTPREARRAARKAEKAAKKAAKEAAKAAAESN